MQSSQQESRTMTTPTIQSPVFTFDQKIDGVDCPLSIYPTTHKKEEEERKEEEAIKKQDQEEKEKETTGEADIEPSLSYVIVGSTDEDGEPWWQLPHHVSPDNAPRFSVASLLERIAMKN